MCVNRPGTERIIILHGVAALLQLQQSTQNDCSMQFSDDGPTKTDVASQKESMDSILPLRIFFLQGNICRWANRAELGGGPFTRIAYVVNKRPPDSYCLP